MLNKKWLWIGAVIGPLCVASAHAQSKNNDNGPGCGLGKELWANASNQKSIGGQVLAATTNGTSGSQTFGISSGTSGCTSDGTILGQYKTRVFAAANFDNLSQDMAKGGGEHLASFAQLLGIKDEQRGEFYALTQENYAKLSLAGEANADAMLIALNQAMASHPQFAQIVTIH
jgi:hypothetical protein